MSTIWRMGMTEVTAADGVRVLDWTFGDRLRKVRRGGGETQAEFAAKLGESVKTYSNWEADRHPPASIVAVAKRVEVATGVPAAWMLGLDNPVPPAPMDRTTTGDLRGSSSRGKVGPTLGVVIRPSFNGSRTEIERVAPAAIRDGEAA